MHWNCGLHSIGNQDAEQLIQWQIEFPHQASIVLAFPICRFGKSACSSWLKQSFEASYIWKGRG